MKIDILYAWVDGADPIWNEERKKTVESTNRIVGDPNNEAFFMDNDELRFSLRSINQYAPWINKIFIVTDNQVPEWLDTSHPKINIVDHKEIFNDRSCLPTFNIKAIETQMHHIAGLSEHFIYFNDDMFLGNHCLPGNFFTKNKLPRIFVSEIIPIPNKKFFDISKRQMSKRNDYQHSIVNTRKLVRRKYNNAVYYNLRHGAKAMLKSGLYEVEEKFSKELEITSKEKFRTNEDILMLHLYGYYSIIMEKGKPKYLKTVSNKKKLVDSLSYFYKKYTFGFINLHEEDIDAHLDSFKSLQPFIFCLNQTADTPKEHLEKMKKFLHDYFPQRSPFEKD